MVMTSKSLGLIASGSLSSSKKFYFATVDFLRTSPPTGANWTVQGSSDGTIGGMGVDVIASPSSFAVGSWAVLQPPHNAYQILISRVGLAGDNDFRVLVNPASDYTGGSAGVEPTSPSSRSYLTFQGTTTTDANVVLQMTADLSEPYGVAIYAHEWNFGANARAAFAVFPLEFENSGGHPYIFYVGQQSNSYYEASLDYGFADNIGLALPKGENSDASGYRSYRSMRLTDNSGSDSFTVGWKIGADDATDTMYFADLNTKYGFKGTSKFVQWIHIRYYTPTTYNSRQNVVFGDVIVPWDGFTIPDPSPIVNYI